MHTIARWRHAIGLAALAFGSLAMAQSADTLTLKRATDLRDAPADTARAVAPLAAQSAVTRLGARQGPWIEVRSAQGQTGWIHLFDAGLPPQQAQGNSASGALRGITSLFSSSPARPATTTATSTIGIRGLGAEELANAQPNLEAVGKAEALRQNAGQARSFGTLAQLQTRPVDPLPVPQPPARSSAPGTPGTPGPGGGAAPAGGER